MEDLAPILLFVYNRPEHTLLTLEALSKNDLAAESLLYIFSDGPKQDASAQELENIKKTRDIIESRRWCKEVIVKKNDQNFGLAESIINGITAVLDIYPFVIVLEDDIVTSPSFLTFMNSALSLYFTDDRVMHISGYQYPIKNPSSLPPTFFVNLPTCWGWATWRRAWKYFTADTKFLINKIDSKDSLLRFNLEGCYDYFKQLELNEKGALHTWAVKWYASFFLQGGFSLHPNLSLTKNIGLDGTGENCGNELLQYSQQKITDKIELFKIPVVESSIARKKIGEFLKFKPETSERKNMIFRIRNKVRKMLPSFIALNMQNPLSRSFGFDRGTPIDRYYIEAFLLKNRELITKTVLEISNPVYALKFGSSIEKIEVLDYTGEDERTTIIGDLTDYENLPSSYVDCFICTQTLNVIYDFKKAIEGTFHLLRRNGVALVTVAGITQISTYDASRWGDFWRFTPQGIKRAFEEVFGVDNIKVESFGNSYSACALLKGFAAEEVNKKKLDFRDEEYPVTISIIARKNV